MLPRPLIRAAHTSMQLPKFENLPHPQLLTAHTDLPLELGGHLADVQLRGHHYGQPLANAPIYVLSGGITADALPLGDGQNPGWWQALEHFKLLNPQKHAILAPGTLGNISDWPALLELDHTASLELPRLTPFDLAEATERWLQAIGCPNGVTWLGASVGGLVGLALALLHPRRIQRLITISAGHQPDGWGTGVRHLQRELVRDALRHDPLEKSMISLAMKRARQLGMLSYRGRHELNTRFGPLEAHMQVPPIDSYLEHNGHKFAKRFSPQRFLLLSDAIDRFHVGKRLDQLQCQVDVIGVPSDLLFPFTLQAEFHNLLLDAGISSRLVRFDSPFGHDAFLADQARLAELLELHNILEK